MEEVSDKGWLSGPYTLEEVQEDWLRVWRFAMHQNGKWGPIDDLTENAVNGAFGCMEKVGLRALD